MILGFILVDIIEQNHFNAVSIHGYAGSLTRPITIVILLIAITVAAVLLRSVSRMERETAIAGDAPNVDVSPRRSWKERLLNPDVIIPLVVIAGVGLLLWDHLHHPVQEKWRFTMYPFWLPVFALGLLGIELWRGIRGPAPGFVHHGPWPGQQGHGRCARGGAVDAGAVRALPARRHDGWPQVGGARVPLAGPVVLLRGHGRWLMALVAAAGVGLFIKVFLDNILFVLYPEPFLREWLTGG